MLIRIYFVSMRIFTFTLVPYLLPLSPHSPSCLSSLHIHFLYLLPTPSYFFLYLFSVFSLFCFLSSTHLLLCCLFLICYSYSLSPFMHYFLFILYRFFILYFFLQFSGILFLLSFFLFLLSFFLRFSCVTSSFLLHFSLSPLFVSLLSFFLLPFLPSSLT